ncbi:hypothetical protein PF002_g20990 [Phytophthora fragariae]|nr:hypothetical protein PF009_g20715 [Phytophthora fragariae]KAE9088665.1 hypothetical protein PF007_g19887 [Phytophthora fragariae]KAE9100830.1 hypothetical protein PF006_g22814 [Phytophthora fragariae]KAE9201751.1 hypothetical protein PF004_g18620 [Phytophthora fragariae]KAE9203252.1 hypothetical protein PF002_g20990 [Phytophthora fragariae]
MVVLVASTNGVVTANTNQVASTTTTATTRNLLSFEDVEPKKTLKSTDLSAPSIEERGAAAAIGGAAAGNSVTVSNKEQTSKTVTVTTYHNNGVWQRFTRWLKRTFSSGSVETSKKTSKTRRLRLQFE